MPGYTPPTPFNPEKEKWGTYMQRFECFLDANDFQGISDDRKRAYFLSHCGPEVFNMAESLSEPTPVRQVPWQVLQQTLKAHYAPAPSKFVQRYELRQRVQKEGESISSYMAALRKAAKHCEYRDLDDALLEQLISGIRDFRLRRRLLIKANLTLATALDEARAHELSSYAADTLTPGVCERPKQALVHNEDILAGSDSEYDELGEAVCRTERAERHNAVECASCGGQHQRQDCRFRDAICRRCERKGHLARVCRAILPPRTKQRADNKPRNRESARRPPKGQPKRSETTSFTNSTSVREKPAKTSKPQSPPKRNSNKTSSTVTIRQNATSPEEKIYTTPYIGNVPCRMEIDTGSAITIMSWEAISAAVPGLKKQHLKPQRLRVQDYQGNRIPILGIATVLVTYGRHQKTLPVTIVKDQLTSLLGLDWFRALGMEVKGIHSTDCSVGDELLQEFPEVFTDGLGKYVGTPISFNLDPTIAPIRLKARRVPFALKPKIDHELDRLVSQGILVPVDHAKWETPIVTPIKPDGTIRICADYKATLNKALQKSAYPVPVVQHLLHSLGPGKIFAKLDLAQAYQQLPVDQETAEAQTIVTHRGAFRCTRLQFGVSVAPGLFQNLMERLLQGIPGVVPYFDDVLISAKDETELHARLRRVLTVFRDAGLKAKLKKCHIGVPSVEFLGYRIDSAGIHPTEDKLRAIQQAPAPKNKAELQAFLGLLNFYAVFLKDKATVAEPLHKLLAKNAPWKWGKNEAAAFAGVKGLLSGKNLLIQYNHTMPLVLVCDASPYGVGAVLSHRLPNGTEAPIAYFSRTLAKAERNYSQLDREALALVAGIKKFHEYLFGRHFEVITDHRPLLGLLAGDRPTPVALSPRLTRWAIFLSAYSYKLTHRPGSNMGHADALSRCPLPDLVSDPTPGTPTILIDSVTMGPITSVEVAKASARDIVTRTVLGWVQRGWPQTVSKDFKNFFSKRTELSAQGGCLLWGDRVVIPEKLRSDILELLHVGHPGIVRMKGLARSYVWWPSLDKDISDWVGKCHKCQDSRPLPPTTPPREWEKPQGPWSRIHIDFAGPSNGHTFLVIVDAYSKWLEVFLMKTTTSEAVIRVLRRLFATHGLPDILVSDNGPQFTAMPFEQYLASQGIRHALSAPWHPASNGMAERFVRSAKEALARLLPGDCQEKLDLLLACQHVTPSASTGRSPAELLMGRRLRCPLDRLSPIYSPEKFNPSGPRDRGFGLGDPVYARNYGEGSLWKGGEIIKITGPKSYIVDMGDGTIWRRHIDQLRKRLANKSEPDPDFELLHHPTANEVPSEPEYLAESGWEQRHPQVLPDPCRNDAADNPGLEGQSEELGGTTGPSDQLDSPPKTELRRSARHRQRPGYLRDYVCK